MLENSKRTPEFFNNHGMQQYSLKSIDEYMQSKGIKEQVSKDYFPGKTLHEMLELRLRKRSSSEAEFLQEQAKLPALLDFLGGLLTINPLLRWTPQQARLHPFITGEPFIQPVSAVHDVFSRFTVRGPGPPYSQNTGHQRHGSFYDPHNYHQHQQQQPPPGTGPSHNPAPGSQFRTAPQQSTLDSGNGGYQLFADDVDLNFQGGNFQEPTTATTAHWASDIMLSPSVAGPYSYHRNNNQQAQEPDLPFLEATKLAIIHSISEPIAHDPSTSPGFVINDGPVVPNQIANPQMNSMVFDDSASTILSSLPSSQSLGSNHQHRPYRAGLSKSKLTAPLSKSYTNQTSIESHGPQIRDSEPSLSGHVGSSRLGGHTKRYSIGGLRQQQSQASPLTFPAGPVTDDLNQQSGSSNSLSASWIDDAPHNYSSDDGFQQKQDCHYLRNNARFEARERQRERLEKQRLLNQIAMLENSDSSMDSDSELELRLTGTYMRQQQQQHLDNDEAAAVSHHVESFNQSNHQHTIAEYLTLFSTTRRSVSSVSADP